MMSFFWGNKVKTTYTKTGSHARHWYAVFDEAGVQDRLYDRFTQALETGERRGVSKQVYVIEDPLIRAVVYKDAVLTAFPHWKGDRYEKYETIEIVEWSHSSGLEAIVHVRHVSGCVIKFFAADYAKNKHLYTAEKNISVNMVGFVYSIELFADGGTEININLPADVNMENYTGPRTLKLDANFCSYMPSDELDEVNFVGHIQSMREHAMDDIQGYVLTVDITPELIVDMFIARANVNFELAVGMHISGLAWMQGTLDDHSEIK